MFNAIMFVPSKQEGIYVDVKRIEMGEVSVHHPVLAAVTCIDCPIFNFTKVSFLRHQHPEIDTLMPKKY